MHISKNVTNFFINYINWAHRELKARKRVIHDRTMTLLSYNQIGSEKGCSNLLNAIRTDSLRKSYLINKSTVDDQLILLSVYYHIHSCCSV